MKKLALAALGATTALLIATAPASAGNFDRKCGDQVNAMGAPWTNLKVANASCRAARNLADEYTSAAYEDDYKNWVCNEKSLGAEELKVKCKRPKNGGQKLKFFWGA